MIRLGPAASGSAGGLTAQGGRYGQVVRGKPIPVQPRTGRQGLAKAVLARSSSAWRARTQAQRDGYEGDREDGHAAYTGLSSQRAGFGGGPAIGPSADRPAIAITLTWVTLPTPTGAAILNVAAVGSARIEVWATRCRSAGVRAMGAMKRIVNVTFGGSSSSSSSSNLSLGGGYRAAWGNFLKGRRVRFAVRANLALLDGTLGGFPYPPTVTEVTVL